MDLSPTILNDLPPELRGIVREASDEKCLETLVQASLDARYTTAVLVHCNRFLAHICANLRRHGSFTASIATLARIVPFAPHLTTYATRLLRLELFDYQNIANDDELLVYLLAFYRLLKFDRRIFRGYVEPANISPLLSHRHRAVVYMAIKTLQICLDGADHWFEEMIAQYLGPDNPDSGINGVYDDTIIDYRFLTLWEEQRWSRIALQREQALNPNNVTSAPLRTIPHSSFDSSTTLIGGSLFPKEREVSPTFSDELVLTETTRANLGGLANALQDSTPILVTGLPGCGKTALVETIARKLGKLDEVVTLHLNEQSDAKLLIGIYTTGDVPGSFVWKPGVLTTAVQEGRWVVIENLDRAPNEIIGTLLPLIEKRELFIPNRKQTLHAAEGFRIIATARSTSNHRGDEIRPLVNMVGARHWQVVPLQMPATSELQEMAAALFPSLREHLPRFIAVYERLQGTKDQSFLIGQSKSGVQRSITPREFLKWCSRVRNLLGQRTTFSSSDLDDILMEAIDCFVGALPEGPFRDSMVYLIAEELHIDPQRRDFLTGERDIRYHEEPTAIAAGRYRLNRSAPRSKSQQSHSSFSTNPHTSRMLERVAAAVVNREPLLLVGETGVGKTTAIQHLASSLGKKLQAFNLSQQSEAGDLLGGFKPVTPRGMVVSLQDEFDDLFQASFSMTKNQQFLQILGKQLAKGNWKAVCKIWRQALQMVEQHRAASPAREGEAPSKKRKMDGKKTLDFIRWDKFADQVSDLEKRLQSAGASFAFKFVEGNIVKAVRNGDWVLLDEINLASTDTLESLVDLLHPGEASVSLTEAGEVDRVRAHPDFRIFAAMNPATDVGKKDLPPGVRSRFTELYVESPDKSMKSLQSIVKSYLRSETAADPAIATDVSLLYQSIVELARQNRLVDGAGQSPHFSLRTLTRTLSYAKFIAPQCNLRRALYEGFQMSFMTFLDDESAKLVQPLLEQHLFGKKVNIRAELKRSLRKPDGGQAYIQGHPESKHWVRQGRFPPQEQPHYILTPFIRKNMENLVRAASTRKFPVLIQGPTSSGKTSMIEYLAKRTGHRFVRINNHEHTDLQEYLGTYVSDEEGRLTFQEGVLVKALREGHWVVLDELNLAPTDVLEALNRLLDDNRELLIPETQETVRPHEDFMLFATQNPAGLYGGRKVLSRAFRNRFLELHFDDIPIDELQEILHRRTQLPESRCKRVVTVYRELSVLRQENRLFEQKSFATLRDLFRWALRPNDTIEQLAVNGFMLLAERVRKPEEREVLKEIIERVMSSKGPRVTIEESSLYGQDCLEIQEFNKTSNQEQVIWTKAMRRLYVLVSRALANHEPVLLVGETGCGKTTVCQMLADVLNKRLHTVNAHQNTETGDLIGSQRPVRNRANVEASLRQLLISSPVLQELGDLSSQSTDALLEAYDRSHGALESSQASLYRGSSAHLAIQKARTRFKALFEWADGPLVEAMREGSLFLLDEISLADDSVLERLNSVLESDKSILLAEKGSMEAFVSAQADFQFFATMNPGGDYGKRELSPALRNRFTEIWVPALTDMDDAIQIVSAKLVTAAKSLASPMVEFAQWFQDTYNTSATSSISLRDMLAWVQFINVSPGLETMLACVHGASMVYIDTMGANPAGLMTITARSLEDERRVCLEKLGGLLNVDAVSAYSHPVTVQVSSSSLDVGPFSMQRRTPHAEQDLSFTFEAPTSRLNVMRVVRAMQLSKPVMIEGSPGVGKTALVTALAKALDMSLVRINLSDQTDMMDLFGSDVPVEGEVSGTFSWRDAPFLRAMKTGEWVLLDEMNLASQSVLEGLNACLDHRGEVFIPELGQSFSRHPEFRMFAAQNPHHQGGGRKGLPASFVNRFSVVYADSFKPGDLSIICTRNFPQLEPQLIDQAAQFVDRLELEVSHRGAFGASGGPWEFNLRDTSRWLSLLASQSGFLKACSVRDCFRMLFLHRFRVPNDRSQVAQLFESLFPDSPPETELVSTLSSSHVQLSLGLMERDLWTTPNPVLSPWTPCTATFRILESIMVCVQQDWPVIITGSSGAGKTTLLQHLASAVGASLSTISVNADTDALDLVGGYEQADPGRQVVEACETLRLQLQHALKKDMLDKGPTSAAYELLQQLDRVKGLPDLGTLTRLSECLKRAAVDGSQELADKLDQLEHVADKARFQWVDGLLVDALQRGDWLVLDNANLCSAAVLDRLNSLLEPNGALIVSEHCEADGSPKILRPHPKFRIFLTVDPKYGELSRAVRNRAVELFMSAEGDQLPALQPLDTESAVARFRNILPLCKPTPPESALKIAPLLVLENVALADLPLFTRFNQQAQAGLLCIGEAPDLVPPEEVQEIVKRLSPQLRELYDAAVGQDLAAADLVNVQTLHPLHNPVAIHQSQQSMAQASVQATVWDTCLASANVMQSLDILESDARTQSKLARIEKTILSKRGTATAQAIGRGIVPLVKNLLQRTVGVLLTLHATPDWNIAQLRLNFRHLTSFLIRFVRAMSEGTFDQTVYLAWATVFSDTLSALRNVHETTFAPIEEFQSRIKALATPSIGVEGSGLSALWKAFRTPTCASIDQLKMLLQFESQMDQFDSSTRDFTMPSSTIAELRLSFSRVWHLAVTGTGNMQELSTTLTSLMPSPSQAGDNDTIARLPHFASVFDQLRRRLAIKGVPDSDYAALELLSGRSSKHSLLNLTSQPPDSTAAVFAQLTTVLPSWTMDEPGHSPTLGFAPMILESLSNVANVSMANLELLESEVNILSRSMASHAKTICRDDYLLSTKSLEVIVHTILQPVAGVTETSEWVSNLASASGNLLNSSPHTSSDSLREFADTWFHLGVQGLTLYLPAEAFDPALGPRLKREIHQFSVQEISASRDALKTFQRVLFGEEETLRTRVLTQELYNLGAEPTVDTVCRPPSSELAQLQGEFDSLRRLVQRMRKDKYDPENRQANSHMRENVLHIRQRLAERYRAYDDLTNPVVGLIDCVRLSWELYEQANSHDQAKGGTTSTLVPFVGATPRVWLSDQELSSVLDETSSAAESLLALSSVAARRLSSSNSLSAALRSTIDDKLFSFYKDWQQQLSEDQRKTAAKSSLYRYQGDQDLEDEDSEEAVESMFPGAEPAATQTKDFTSTKSLQGTAAEISRIHSGLFASEVLQVDDFIDLLRKSAQHRSIFGDQTSRALPAAFLQLEDLRAVSEEAQTNAQTYDMYRHPNMAEMKKLVAILQEIKRRFQQLHIAWPEHATPIDVLRLCDQVVHVSHREPLTAFFPLLEKLHGTVAEWQKISSREFSAVTAFEHLTDLIIAWRQLELSSWAGLLARELSNCENEARSWWFVAFESIIAATKSLLDSPEELKEHTTGLLQTLETFILNCGLGEYRSRLSILRDFERHLFSETFDHPELLLVQQALANFVSYFDRFIPAIEEALTTGRAKLEKDIKNVVQVASWKDRNVEVLRQSAKSSHKKLLRLVRRFRVLLAKPVGPIIQQTTPKLDSLERKAIATVLAPQDIPTNGLTSEEIPQTHVWSDRPRRFRDVSATTSLMAAHLRQSSVLSTASRDVAKFCESLAAEVGELQKATPSILTEENKALVLHLKTRKRRLLADVLKTVRSMGFQTSQSESALAQQSSIAKILASLPSLSDRFTTSQADEAESVFYNLLAIIPTVRESSRKHSEDLTSAEASRCLMLLESMLNVSLTRRRNLDKHLEACVELKATTGQMHTFAIRETTAASRSCLEMHLQSLLKFVKTCARLVQIQSSLAQRDHEFVLQSFSEITANLEELWGELAVEPAVPSGVALSSRKALQERYTSVLEGINALVANSVQKHPELEPTMSHLIAWTDISTLSEAKLSLNGTTHIDIDTWTTDFLATLDQILGGTQGLAAERSSKLQEEDASWLMTQQRASERDLKVLRITNVQRSLAANLEGLHNFSEQDFAAASVMCRASFPIVASFLSAASELVSNYAELHLECNKMALQLATSYTILAQKGFCTPSEKSDGDDGQSGQAEAGTGLGDGEGAEDISKDIKDDEDLSELAQGAQKTEDGQEMENEKDAVDMADEELEGDMDEGEEKEDGDEEGGDEADEEGAEMDEEAGDVDDLGPSTVDEKMWDEGKSEGLRDKEAEDAKGKEEQDLGAAEQDDSEQKRDGEQQDDLEADAGADEEDNVGGQEAEKMDSHTREEDNLDLPEDMNMDDDDKGAADDESDFGSVPEDALGKDTLDEPEQQGEDTMPEAEQDPSELPADLDAEDQNDIKEGADQSEEENEDAQSDVLMKDDKDQATELDDNVVAESGTGSNEEQDRAKLQDQASGPQEEQDEEGDAETAEQSAPGQGNKGQQSGEDNQGQDAPDERAQNPFKALGDALEDWYKQNRPIDDAQDEDDQPQREDIDMADAQFEHLSNDNAQADTQALGAASAEQSKALDEDRGLDVNDQLEEENKPFVDDSEQEDNVRPERAHEEPASASEPQQQDAGPKAFVGESKQNDLDIDMQDAPPDEDSQSEHMSDMDDQLLHTHISNQPDSLPQISIDEARILWTTHESRTRNLALILTEHLRLILQPTQATKMRGDFRTGKRLNIKRIIPYIASSYKRDKIWMRRSVPSKRAYQIMLAIDDSQSMAESDNRDIAFDTLALISKAMSTLEVGELSIVRFGQDVAVAHDFSAPLTSDAGAGILQQFTFAQAKTDVKKLLQESMEVFRAARLKAAGSAGDLWQLQVVISDGVCEDHEGVRRLVRQAFEERIMVVFVVGDVEKGGEGGDGEGETRKKQSIVDLQTAEFVKDAQGEMQLRMVKYLDTFPFRYYLIVRDVQELPGVLAGALRQWFSEVVDTGGG